MTDQKNDSNLELDAFFASAKRSVPTPSEKLKDKIMQDAQQEAQQWEKQPPVRSQKAWWRILFEDIGGFRSVAGYGTAAIFGMFIGFSAPDWSSLAEQLVDGTTTTQIEFTDPFAGLDLSYFEG